MPAGHIVNSPSRHNKKFQTMSFKICCNDIMNFQIISFILYYRFYKQREYERNKRTEWTVVKFETEVINCETTDSGPNRHGSGEGQEGLTSFSVKTFECPVCFISFSFVGFVLILSWRGFLTFSEGVEMEHWLKMGQLCMWLECKNFGKARLLHMVIPIITCLTLRKM